MKKYPNVSVKIIFKHKNKILMLKHKDEHFGFPGGGVEWKEPVLEALKRELKEELNYNLKKEPELFDVWDYIPVKKKIHSVFIYYIYPLNKKLNFISPEKLQTLWLTKKDMLAKNIIKNKKFLDKIFNYGNKNKENK